MIEKAIRLLDEGDCTLAVVSGDSFRKGFQQGVGDLVDMLDEGAGFLDGACVADKVVGKAAASLMIEGRVAQVYSRVMTGDALALFDAVGIPATYTTLADIVENRDKTGRCPLDTLCSALKDTAEMAAAVRRFVREQRLRAH